MLLLVPYMTTHFSLGDRNKKTSSASFPSFTTTPPTPTNDNGLSIASKSSSEKSNHLANSTTKANVALPWIPVIGLVCPEQSVLFKKLLNTNVCSNNDTAQPKKHNGTIMFVGDADHKRNITNGVKDIDGNHETVTVRDNAEVEIKDKRKNQRDENDTKVFAEILNNPVVLETILEKWKDALNNSAQILSKSAMVSQLNTF